VEIHKPKPVRDWREFLSEMSVIVLGILIALGGEQLIETLHWRYEVRETEARLAGELGANAAIAMWRVHTASCVEKRLDEIGGIIDAAATSGKLPPIGALGQPLWYLWGHGTWDSAVASQTATHFPAQRLANFAVAYQFISRLGEINQRELEAWTDLWVLVGPGRPFDSSAAASARLAASRARFLSRAMQGMSQGLRERVKALNLPPHISARVTALEAAARQPLSTFEICKPMGREISPIYGQSPSL
jgi:hypothetical protein